MGTEPRCVQLTIGSEEQNHPWSCLENHPHKGTYKTSKTSTPGEGLRGNEKRKQSWFRKATETKPTSDLWVPWQPEAPHRPGRISASSSGQTEQGRALIGEAVSVGPEQCCAEWLWGNKLCERPAGFPFIKWDPSESLFHPLASTPRCDSWMEFC